MASVRRPVFAFCDDLEFWPDRVQHAFQIRRCGLVVGNGGGLGHHLSVLVNLLDWYAAQI